MARKKSHTKQELVEQIANYETAKANGQQIYLDGDQLADIANWYICEQQFIKAQEVINYGFHLHPDNTDLHIEQAYLCLDTGAFQEAKKIADSLTEETFEVKILKAEILLHEEKLEEAKQILQTVEEKEEDFTIISDIVYLYLDMGYPEVAHDWLESVKEQYKDDTEYIALTADYLSSSGQHKAAIDVYNQLIDKSPYNSSYWMGLAKSCFFENNIDKTIEACDFALAANENCNEAYSYKAHCFFYLGNMDAAIDNYQEALTHHAIPPEMAYMFIGMSYSDKKEWEKANEYFEKTLCVFKEKGIEDPLLLTDVYINQACVLLRLERFNEAHQCCNKCLLMNPEEGNAYLTHGRIYLMENQVRQASMAFKKAEKLQPYVEMYYAIASYYLDSQHYRKAKQYYEKVYSIDPEFESTKEKLAALSLEGNDADEFFKYNDGCENPVTREMIEALLATPHPEKNDVLLKEILRRMDEKEHK